MEMDKVFEDANRLADNATGLLEKLAPGRTDLIFAGLTIALIKMTGGIYGERAARQLQDTIQSISKNGAPNIANA